MPLKILNPLDSPHWDDLVLTHPDYTFFHSSAWARVLHESYGYKPVYFTEVRNGTLSTLIPLMEVNSLLTGKRGVSLPFSDYCPPLLSDKNQFDKVFAQIVAFGKQAGWKSIEWRGTKGLLEDQPASSTYFEHTLDLSTNGKAPLSTFRSSTRRNIKKAMKQGVEIDICFSSYAVKRFCRLNGMTRKMHGLPPQPYAFFRNLHEHVILKRKGFVILASQENKDVAGAVYLHFGKKALYKYGASDKRFQNLRANNLVMWKAVEWHLRNGHQSLNLGKTDPENLGLMQYKQGWRGEKKIISYHTYDLATDTFISNERNLETTYGFLKRLPSPLLNMIGALFYKHMG